MASAKRAPAAIASTEEVEEMREVFAMFDKDASGAVTTAELAMVLKSMNKNYSEADLKKIINKFDVNGDGQIDFDEFLAVMKSREVKEENELKQAFDVFDKELEIVMRALGEPLDRQTLDLMIESVDTDKSGFIDFNEFREMMAEGPPKE